VDRLAGAGERDRGDEPDFDAGLEQPPGERPVIVAGRLEGGDHEATATAEQRDEAVMIGARVEHGQAASAAPTG
jgi:hypothetical protein